MPEIDELIAAVKERLIPEVKTAVKAAEAADLPVRVWPPDWESTGQIDYLYRSGSLLIRDQHVPQVMRALQDLPTAQSGTEQGHGAGSSAHQEDKPVEGVTRLTVPVSESWHT